MYALEVFINWCEENFSSVEQYFEIGLEKKEAREKKEQELKASFEEQAVEKMKEQTKMKKSKIKGLMEIEFLS
jgi:sortase (surface protein transpeptidase)